MMYFRRSVWMLAGCLAMGVLLTTAGCRGCAGPGPLETPDEEETEVVRVLEPEESPRNELDSELREKLRSHALVQGIFDGEPPRLTFESEQETPRATITVYEAETLEQKVRLRALWTLEVEGIELTGIDVQHRDGAAFQREWNADA